MKISQQTDEDPKSCCYYQFFSDTPFCAQFVIGILEKAVEICRKLQEGERVRKWFLLFKQTYLKPMKSELAKGII